MVWCFFLLSGSHVAAMSTYGDLTIGVCNSAFLWFLPLVHMCLLLMVCGLHQECTVWLLLPLPQVGSSLMLLFTVLSAIPPIWWGNTALGTWQSHLMPPPSPYDGYMSSFPDSAPPYNRFNSESVVEVKPGDSGVGIEYQPDEFDHTWLLEHFLVQSHIYPPFIGKMSTLTHFIHELGCEDYSFLDQAVEDFENDLDSILMDSIGTPELDASPEEADAIPSSVFSGFLHSVCTISDTSRLQLAPSIRSHMLWCQARGLLLPFP